MAGGSGIKVGQVAPVIIMIFANFFGQNLIFPFLPFMVKDFLGVERSEAGFYSGFLAAAYPLGSFFGSLLWGAAADRFGRRPALLASLSLTIFWMLLFGFSRAFWWAVLVRFVWGLSSGIVGIGKTLLSESTTDKSAARTFSLLGVVGGLGRVTGPATGGLLVGFIPGLPYLLPLLVCVGFSGASLILSFFFLKETLVKGGKKMNKPLPRNESLSHVELTTANTEQLELLPATTNGRIPNGTRPLVNGQANGSLPLANGHAEPKASFARNRRQTWHSGLVCCCLCSDPESGYRPLDASQGATAAKTCCCSCLRRFANTMRDYSRLLSDSVIRTACIAYTLLALTATMHQHLIPLLLIVNFAHGGLCMNSAEIGLVLAVVGVFQLIVQLAVYAPLSKKIGHRNMFRIGLVGLIIFLILFPWLSTFTGSQDPLIPTEASPLHASNDSVSSEWNANMESTTTVPFYAANASEKYDVWNTSYMATQSPDLNASQTTSFYESSDVCMLDLSKAANEIDECGRPLAKGGRTGTINFGLVACLSWHVWLTVFIVVGGGFFTRTVSFTSSNILINNSCEMEVRARVNGMSMSMSSVGRFIAPLIVSNLWAATDVNDPNDTFVPQHHIASWLTALLAFFAILVNLRLPKSIEKKKIAVARVDEDPREMPVANDDNGQDGAGCDEDDETHSDREALISSEHRPTRTNTTQEETAV